MRSPLLPQVVVAGFSLFLLFLLSTISAAAILPVSGSYAVQPFVFPSTSPPSSTVIPAFPEQSDIAGPCPLDLPDDLFSGISHACSGLLATSTSTSTPSPPSPTARLRCCPSLAAWLYTAHSAAALQSTRFLPGPASSSSPADLPVLPDDSEACAETAEKSLKARGVALARANESCGAVYCYCGIHLRPLSCPGGIRVEKAGGRWVAADDAARRIERDCDGVGVEGCSRCLRSLYQLNRTAVAGGNHSSSGTASREGGGFHDTVAATGPGDCALMGLTWLLASNRTRYLPVVTRVLRTLMFSPAGAASSSCSGSFPLAVGSAEIDDEDLEAVSSSSSGLPPPHQALLFPAALAILVLRMARL